jgi:glutamate-1-semialdehyde 2,1-aminomutase
MTIETAPLGIQLRDAYRLRTPQSARLFERAMAALPGGSTRTTVFFDPYPPYAERGSGAHLHDVDGNRYLDLLNNYTSLILGHAHPEVVAAVERQLPLGSAFGGPSPVEVDLAELIKERVPSVEELRFTNSGTEATMFALRLARAHTGRDVIAKFDGAYHGTHDWALAGTRGVPAALNELVVELPYNDIGGVRERLAGRERTVAAIIIEPVLGAGGMRPADPGFLADLRELTTSHGIVLIYDEIIAFRIGYHGAQGVLGGDPDLTTFGKIVGGGFPLAAFGGKRELMELFDSRRADGLGHGGTFNGNPVAAQAGLATLHHLTPARFEELNREGARLRSALQQRADQAELDVEVTGAGSLFHIHLGRRTLSAAEQAERQSLLHLALLVDGYFLAPRGMGALTTPMTADEIDGFVEFAAVAMERVLS